MKSRTLLALGFCALVALAQTNDGRLRKELKSGYSKWPDQDVAYILTDAERSAFNGLHNDEEREQFIEEFWRWRDPTPETEENEFKEEHYRRIAYANERFASGMPGWKTDRGRLYITFGPPDEIESHPSGGTYQRTPNEGGGTTSTFPFERWRYRYLADIGNDITVEFVDPTMTGEYRITIDPNEKDALQKVAGHQPPELPNTASNNQFTRVEQLHLMSKPPRMPELLAIARSVLSYNVLPFRIQVNYFPLTDASSMVYVSLQFENKDLQFQAADGVMKASLSLAGGVTTLTRRNVTSFEDQIRVDTPSAMLSSTTQRKSVYSHVLILAPGTYRLQVVAKDTIGGNTGMSEVPLEVPNSDSLQISSVVLADMIEHVPTRSAGAGQFVIGDYKVRPRVDGVFHRDEKLGLFFKLSRTASNPVEFEVVQKGTNAPVIQRSQEAHLTVDEFFDISALPPGQYTLRVKAGDDLTRSVPFEIR